MDTDLAKLVVVITGASSGFGRGTALRLAGAGARVVLAARRGERLEELAIECMAAGGQALAVETDVSIPAEVTALTERTLERYGRIDVWINNAGAAAVGPFTDVPVADHQQVIATDLLGVVYGSHHALRRFRAQGGGTLINVASMIGKVPAPYYASYTAAKFGVVGLSAALRQEIDQLGLDGIAVCTVLPMAMDTPFFEHAANATDRRTEEIPPMDDADKVIDAIVGLIAKPQPEVHVGRLSTTFDISHNLAPGITEKLQAMVTDWAQMQHAQRRGPTPGALREPTSHGGGVKSGQFHEHV